MSGSGPRIVLNAINTITGRDVNYTVSAGTTSSPKVYYLRLGPDKSVEVVTTLFYGRDPYLACLYVYESSVFLEANDESLWVLAPTWKPHRQNSWDRVLLPKSTGARQIVLRLRPLDAFILSESERFVLNYLDIDDYPFDSQVVHLSGESQVSMGGYEESQVDATDDYEYLPVRSDSPLLTSLNPCRSVPELESDKENQVLNLAKDKIENFRSVHPVTLDEIRRVADNVRKAEALRSEKGSEHHGMPFLSYSLPSKIKTEQETGIPLSSTDNLSHGHPANPLIHVKTESGAASDSDSIVVNKDPLLIGTSILDNLIMGLVNPPIPQIDGSTDKASIEAPGGHQASVRDEESTNSEARSPVPFSPVDHSTLTVFDESTKELPSGEVELDASTSTDMLEHRVSLEDATMRPALHSPVLSNKRPSLSGDEEEILTHESIKIQQRSSLRASSAPPKKRRKSSTEPETPAIPSTPRSPIPQSPTKSKKSLKGRRSSPRPSKSSSTPEEHREEVATSTPQKNLRNSAEREKVAYAGPDPKVVFSSNISIQNKPTMMKFLKENGVKVVEEMEDATIFCVGKGELKKTARLINAIASGKDIVTDSWVTDSVKNRHLLDVTRFTPSDRKQEKEWGFKVADAVKRGKNGHKPLKGYRVYFSKALAKAGGTELKDIAILAGAEYCGAQIRKAADDFLVILIGEDDADAKKFINKGFRTYAKELLTLGILRAELDLDDEEFKIGLDLENDE